MRKAVCIAMIVFLFVLGLFYTVSAKDMTVNKWGSDILGLKYIKVFGRIDIQLTGSTKQLGLDKEKLKNYFLLEFNKNFSEIRYDPSIQYKITKESTKKNMGYIDFYVWTVGEDYPIAYHTRLQMVNIKNEELIEIVRLGVSSKEKINNTVKDAIAESIENCATTFFQVRGEL